MFSPFYINAPLDVWNRLACRHVPRAIHKRLHCLPSQFFMRASTFETFTIMAYALTPWCILLCERWGPLTNAESPDRTDFSLGYTNSYVWWAVKCLCIRKITQVSIKEPDHFTDRSVPIGSKCTVLMQVRRSWPLSYPLYGPSASKLNHVPTETSIEQLHALRVLQ